MTGSPRALRPRCCLSAAAALLVVAGCHHENPPSPQRAAIDVSEGSLATSERGAPANFDVVLRSHPAAPVEVEVRSDDPTEGLVLAPGYAVPTPTQSIVFTPEDWDVPRSVAVHGVDDHAIDGDVAYTVTLRVAFSEDAEYASAPGVVVHATNADDDAPGITVSTHALTTFESYSEVAKLEVALEADPGTWIYVIVECADPTEGRLPQYGSSSTTLWFDSASWNVPKEVWIEGVDDPVTDGNQTYAVTIRPVARWDGDPWGAVPAQVVWVTNVDDETPGFSVIHGTVPLVTSENGAAATFEVVLNVPPEADVVIPVASGDPIEGLVAAGALPPAASLALTFTPANWSQAQAVTIVPQDDEVAGDDVAYVVTVGPPTGADPEYPGLSAQTLAVLNLDDDVAALTIDPAGPFTTSEAGSTATFWISIRPPKENVLVEVTSGNPAEGLLERDGQVGVAASSVGMTFSPTDWRPRQVTIVGQPDQALDGDQTYVVTVAVASGDPRYVALAPRGITVTNTNDLASSVVHAEYDPGFGVPRCAGVTSGCGSGSLLVGRDADTRHVPEIHAPNTLGSTCADGTYDGMNHSLDELRIYTLDGSPLAPGKNVRIEARALLYHWYYDRLDLYFAADANAPVWTLVATLQSPFAYSGSSVVLSASFTLPSAHPSAGIQAIRGSWRYGGTEGPCTTGISDDRDDLVFAVSP